MAKAKKEELDKFAKMRALATLINKSQWGGRGNDIATVLGAEDVVSNVTKFSTGDIAIDYAFGGGVPEGKIIELWGGESAGKSTLIYHIIANFQKKYPSRGILLLDTEGSYDPLYAEALGVDAKGIIHVECESGLGALNIAKLSGETGDISLIIIDSIAALTTKSDDNGDIGDQMMAEQARMVSQAFRVLNALRQKYNITIAVTNQIRDNIGVSYGDKTSTPAGKALKHYAHIRVKMTRTNKIKNKSEEVVAVEGKLECVKNKVAPPFRKAEYTITFGRGIDSVIGVVKLAVSRKVLKKQGAWLVWIDGKEKFQGVPNLVDFLRKNPDALARLTSAVQQNLDGGGDEQTEDVPVDQEDDTGNDTGDEDNSVEVI